MGEGVVEAAAGGAPQVDRVLGQTLLPQEIREGEGVVFPEVLRRSPLRGSRVPEAREERAVSLLRHSREPEGTLVGCELERPLGPVARLDHEPLAAEVVYGRPRCREGIQLEAEGLDPLQRDVVVVGDARGPCLAAEVLREITQGLDAAARPPLRFEHQHVVPRLGELVGGAQTRQAGPDHDDPL